jgi:hypothetical protein
VTTVCANGLYDVDAMHSDLWTKSRTGTLRRVAVLELATLALRSGFLDRVARADAERAAHKIARVAPRFGYWDAAELAREAEAGFEGGDAIPSNVALRLTGVTAELRELLSAGPAG